MKKFLIWCSKYVSIPSILFVGALIYIVFLQENSIGKIYDNNLKIDSLNVAIARERDTLDFYAAKNRLLDRNDPELIERIVRENHNMSLQTEDVYVFK